MIAEEEATARAFSGLSDDQASKEIIESCRQRISLYARTLSQCRSALGKLHPIDQHILELAYMGPRDPRKDWFRRPAWKEIAAAVGYCESTTRVHERAALQALSKALESDTETTFLDRKPEDEVDFCPENKSTDAFSGQPVEKKRQSKVEYSIVEKSKGKNPYNPLAGDDDGDEENN